MSDATQPTPFYRRRAVVVAALVLAVVGILLELFVFEFRTAFINAEGMEEVPAFNPDGSVAGTMTVDEMTAEMAELADQDVAGSESMADMTGGVTEVSRGRFEGFAIHDTSGDAVLLELADGRRFVRFEDLDSDNGPDLRVYLSAAGAGAPEGDHDENFVDLGELKYNLGDANYEIPAEVDLDEYNSVVIWCRRFAVGFGVAPI